jgi:hypothetical protein
MAELSLVVGASATCALVFKDAAGSTVPAVLGGAVSVSDSAIGSAVLASDDASVSIAAAALGTLTVTYTNGALSASLSVTVNHAPAVSVEFVPAP